MTLSILICSLKSRAKMLKKLLMHLENQLTDVTITKFTDGNIKITGQKNNHKVEIVTFVDNKEISTGKKRNKLLNRAEGEYIVFIDDDDWVPDYYIREMVRGCSYGCDCLAINGTITTDGCDEIKWRISKDYDNITVIENGRKVYLRKTNHVTAVKWKHALEAAFPNKSNAEDKSYSDALNPYLKTEFVIDLPMYHYRFSTLNKEYK